MISNSVIDFAFRCFSDASDLTVPFQFLYVQENESDKMRQWVSCNIEYMESTDISIEQGVNHRHVVDNQVLIFIIKFWYTIKVIIEFKK